MKKVNAFLIGLIILMVIGYIALLPYARKRMQEKAAQEPSLMMETPAPVISNVSENIDDSIFQNYGSQGSTVRQDLQCVANLLENFDIIVKPNGRIPLANNADFVAAFRGKNPASKKFIRDNLQWVNAAGEFVDRFGTAIYIHQEEGARYAIRSAGPDKEMWTSDDEHRAPDGSYLSGESLVPKSLMKERVEFENEHD